MRRPNNLLRVPFLSDRSYLSGHFPQEVRQQWPVLSLRYTAAAPKIDRMPAEVTTEIRVAPFDSCPLRQNAPSAAVDVYAADEAARSRMGLCPDNGRFVYDAPLRVSIVFRPSPQIAHPVNQMHSLQGPDGVYPFTKSTMCKEMHPAVVRNIHAPGINSGICCIAPGCRSYRYWHIACSAASSSRHTISSIRNQEVTGSGSFFLHNAAVI